MVAKFLRYYLLLAANITQKLVVVLFQYIEVSLCQYNVVILNAVIVITSHNADIMVNDEPHIDYFLPLIGFSECLQGRLLKVAR